MVNGVYELCGLGVFMVVNLPLQQLNVRSTKIHAVKITYNTDKNKLQKKNKELFIKCKVFTAVVLKL
jgi:hypothetical protein